MQVPEEGAAQAEVPSSLTAAVEHLRESFDTIHFQYGWTTRQLCFAQLHSGCLRMGTRNFQAYVLALPQLKERVGGAAARRFDELIAQNTAPAIFKAFYDLYNEGLETQIEPIFGSLLRVGLANHNILRCDPIAWAKALTTECIVANAHKVPIWIKDVCDDHPFDPTEDIDEQIFWRKWMAPEFLVMEPSRYGVYSAEREWDRKDAETSQQWLERFSQDSVMMLKRAVDLLAGTAALSDAMSSKSNAEGRVHPITQNIHLTGPNARVNIGSQDHSTNAVHPTSRTPGDDT